MADPNNKAQLFVIQDLFEEGATLIERQRRDEAQSTAIAIAGATVDGVAGSRPLLRRGPYQRYEDFLTAEGAFMPASAAIPDDPSAWLRDPRLVNIGNAYIKFALLLSEDAVQDISRLDALDAAVDAEVRGWRQSAEQRDIDANTRRSGTAGTSTADKVKDWIIRGGRIVDLLSLEAQAAQRSVVDDTVDDGAAITLAGFTLVEATAISKAAAAEQERTGDFGAAAAWEDFEKKALSPDAGNSFISTEQQFLIKNLSSFAIHNRGIAGYKNFVNVFGDPQSTVTKFVSKPNIEPLLRIRPDQYALIVPKIKLYKVIDKPKGKEPKEKEFLFKTFTDHTVLENIIKSSRGRGDGVGITNVTIEYEGTNQFASRRELAVSIRLHFQSFDNLFDEKTLRHIEAERAPSGPNDPPSYADLIWRTRETVKTKEGTVEANPEHFRIKLVVGWSVPTEKTVPPLIGKKLREAIEETSEAIYLIMVDHDFTFNDDGTIELQIQYRGYIEEALRGAKSDILLDRSLASRKKKLVKEIAKLQNKKPTAGESKDSERAAKRIQLLEDEKEQIILQSKSDKYTKILKGMLRSRSLYFVDCSYFDLKAVRKTSKISHHKDAYYADSRESVHKKILEAVGSSTNDSDLSENISAIGSSDAPWYSSADFDKDCGSYRLRYFYFGDLLELVLKMVKENYPEEFKNIQFLAASFVHRHGKGKKELIPLASIPISMNFFSDWMIKKIISRQRSVYFLLKFIKEFIEEALVKPLNTNLKSKDMGKQNYSTQLSYKTFSLPRSRPGANPIAPPKRKGKRRPSVLTQAQLTKKIWPKGHYGPTAFARTVGAPLKHGSMHYVLIYPYTYDLTPRTGNYSDDFNDGVYHLGIGKNSGIVKEIKFDKQLIPGQAEAQFTEADRAIGQLRRHYNASVTTVGNTLFAPGQPIYIDPTIPGLSSPSRKGSLLRLFGLGGYFVVQKVALELNPDDFTTTLTCIWEAAGDGSTKPRVHGNRAEPK
jgi:hypothetical protein